MTTDPTTPQQQPAEQTVLELADGVTSPRSALLSPDGTYRYRLDRRWGTAPSAVFVMLNPSTADATNDDPTIRRCVGFARRWGAGGLTVVNLYAFRATFPRDLWTAADPVGPDNDTHLQEVAIHAGLDRVPIIAAWGSHAKPERVREVVQLIGFRRLKSLGVTAAGQPRHPLYLQNDAQRSPWRPADA